MFRGYLNVSSVIYWGEMQWREVSYTLICKKIPERKKKRKKRKNSMWCKMNVHIISPTVSVWITFYPLSPFEVNKHIVLFNKYSYNENIPHDHLLLK